jgi:hypothetical protein
MEIERLRKAATASADSPELIEARAEIERLRNVNAAQWVYYEHEQAKRVARKAKAAAADAAAAEKYADEDRAAVVERLVKADKQLAANKTRIKILEAANDRFRRMLTSPTRMSKQPRRLVRSYLHPDRAHKDEDQRWKLERCFQEFSAIKFEFLPDDGAA